MKKVKLTLSKTETLVLKALLEEAGRGEHEMGSLLENLLLVEIAMKYLPKLIFTEEAKLTLFNSEAVVLTKLLYDPHNPGALCSVMARKISKPVESAQSLLSTYNLSIEQ